MTVAGIRRYVRGRFARMKHSWTLALAVSIALLDVIASLVTSEQNPVSIVLLVVHAICVACIGIAPFPASCAVLFVYIIGVLIPQVPGDDSIPGLCFAVAVICATQSKKIGCVALVGLGLFIWSTGMMQDGIASYRYTSTMSVLILVAAIAGWAIAWTRKINDIEKRNIVLKQQVESLKYMQRDLLLSRELHDSLTNDLSFISIIAQTQQRHCRMSGDVSGAEAWRLVFDRTERSFVHVRGILDWLHGSVPDDCQEIDAKTLEERLLDVEQSLHDVGFKGTCFFEGRRCRIAKSIFNEFSSLMKECSTNILRHCNPNSDVFFFSLMIDQTSISLVQMNTIHDNNVNYCSSSGRGLQYHQSIIESLHGEIGFDVESGNWVMRVVVPLS
ncbi:hypothetical protein DSM100688_1983 [Bifidobacterium ramosum]|nr:hypothetical protein DSM100688_1983 [Bifidobacterium ramosum]